MSRNLDPKGKIVRHLGANVFGNEKYQRLLDKRPNPPGPIKHRRGRLSEYGVQLLEKQKLRFAYGLNERQFRNTFVKAKHMKGVTGENLLSLLERRLDNVVYALGIAKTRAQARQIVNHAHIRVNDKKVDIPSFLVSVGDKISIAASESTKKFLQALVADNLSRNLPDWLEFSKVDLSGIIKRLPEKQDIAAIADVHLIVELYSK
ncbi:MAG: 30S ribosomal protein S4 [Chitinispirillales bacterium]|jgi:small subunit ribosomal protein S4|nr:30S ribosomal protein S4 [Chitinispirillales bacterium]